MSRARFTIHRAPALALALFFSASAGAQLGNDPTRPPDGLWAGAAEPGAGEAGGGMVLQSVIISSAGRSAIISGVVVKLGQKYGDAVLVKVAENEVVLKSGSTSQVLKLFPGVDKRDAKMVAQKESARRAGARSKGAPAPDGGTMPSAR